MEKSPADSFLEVLDADEARELIQAMEARGDFKFKGIQNLYEKIADWSSKFTTSSGTLPGIDQLKHDIKLSDDKLKEYLLELTGRGTSKLRFVFSMPAADFVKGKGLQNITVYCRPGTADGKSARRYVQDFVGRNAAQCSKWLEQRKPATGSILSEAVLGAIEKGNLHATLAGAEMSRFFYSDQYKSNEEKREAYVHIIRPLIEQLLRDGKLLLLKSDQPEFKGVYYNNRAELMDRYRILAGYLYTRMLQRQEGLKEGLDFESILAEIKGLNLSGLSEGGRQVVAEITALAPYLKSVEHQEEQKKKEAKANDVLTELAQAHRPVNIERLKNYTPETPGLISGSGVALMTDYVEGGKVVQIALHKNAAGTAVQSARDLFDRSGDDTEIQILGALGVERILNHDLLKVYSDLEQRMLFARLPFFTRLWRSLFGSDKLAPEEAKKLKSKVQKEMVDARIAVETEAARKAQKKLVSERMKAREGKAEEPAKKAAGAPAKVEEPGEGEELAGSSPEAVEKEKKAEEMLARMIGILDEAWQRGELPNRESLLPHFPELDENLLIAFLKKHGRKDIFSYRIHHDKPEYQWPVLISKQYIRKNGRKLLEKAKAEADTQRKASMPNQEKFDVASALEDFLNRLMVKKGA